MLHSRIGRGKLATVDALLITQPCQAPDWRFHADATLDMAEILARQDQPDQGNVLVENQP